METIHDILQNYLPFAPKGFVDEGFNLREHNKLYTAAFFILRSKESTEEQRELAVQVLNTTCYGHVVEEEVGNQLIKWAEALGGKWEVNE